MEKLVIASIVLLIFVSLVIIVLHLLNITKDKPVPNFPIVLVFIGFMIAYMSSKLYGWGYIKAFWICTILGMTIALLPAAFDILHLLHIHDRAHQTDEERD